MNYLCDGKAIIKLALIPAGRLLVASVNTHRFLLATTPVDYWVAVVVVFFFLFLFFSFKEQHTPWGRRVPHLCFVFCCSITETQLKEFGSSGTEAFFFFYLRRFANICPSSHINGWSSTEVSKAKMWNGPSCPFPSHECFFVSLSLSLSPRKHTIRRTGRNLCSMLWWMSHPRSSFKISVPSMTQWLGDDENTVPISSSLWRPDNPQHGHGKLCPSAMTNPPRPSALPIALKLKLGFCFYFRLIKPNAGLVPWCSNNPNLTIN